MEGPTIPKVRDHAISYFEILCNCELNVPIQLDERLLCPDLSIAQIAAVCIQLIILLKTKTRNSWGDLSYVIGDSVDTGMS